MSFSCVPSVRAIPPWQADSSPVTRQITRQTEWVIRPGSDPPYTPDTLIEVQVDDDMVWIRYADWFSRPMRLNQGEALALLAAGETVLSFDTQDEAGALARGLAKLRLATGAAPDVLHIELGVAQESVLRDLRRAVEAGLCVDITYYSFARDERSERRIEPIRFFSDQGNWYVAAFCHLADALRVFRLDRIERLEITDEPIGDVHRGSVEPGFGIDEGPRVTLGLPSGRGLLLDGIPVDSVEEAAGDRLVATLPVSSIRWLE